jgi:hypothetical protein
MTETEQMMKWHIHVLCVFTASLESKRGCTGTGVDGVMTPEIGMSFNSIGDAYDFYNTYSWEEGFGIRYGRSRLNKERRKIMQDIICSRSVSFGTRLRGLE